MVGYWNLWKKMIFPRPYLRKLYQGKSLFVLDKEEQLPNCSDICKPTPEKECIEEEAELLHRPARVRRRIISLSSEEDVDFTEDASYWPSVESKEEGNTTAAEVEIGKLAPRKRTLPIDPSSPNYGKREKKVMEPSTYLE